MSETQEIDFDALLSEGVSDEAAAPQDVDTQGEAEEGKPNADESLKPNADFLGSLTDDQIERLAFENGYNRKGAKSPKQFVEDGLPYILSNKVLIKQLNDQLLTIKSNQDVEINRRLETERAFMMANLKREAAQAAEDGDTAKVQQLMDKQQEILSSQKKEDKPDNVDPQAVFAEQEFLRNNSWYNKDDAMTAAFDTHLQKYLNNGYPVASAIELADREFKQTTSKIRNTDGGAKETAPQGRTAKNLQSGSVKPRTVEALNNEGRAALKDVLKMGRETFGLEKKQEKAYVDNWLKRTATNNFVKGGA